MLELSALTKVHIVTSSALILRHLEIISGKTEGLQYPVPKLTEISG